jgi:creatinine amidohydrolase
MRVVGDVGWWLHSAGVDKLPILNGHGGNVAPLTCAARTLEHDLALSTKVMTWAYPAGILEDVLQDVPEAPEYTHGGIAETSLRLSLPIIVVDNGGYGEIRAQMIGRDITPKGRTRMTVLPLRRSVGLSAATASSRVATVPVCVRSRPSRTRSTICTS